MTGPSRRFAFTLNNYTDAELKEIKEFGSSEATTYVCYGLEEAPTTGTPHVQGYFSVKIPVRLNGIFRKFRFPFLARARFEIANGTRDQNRHYCFKTRPQDTTPNTEIYESLPPAQGRRTDLERACETLRAQGLTVCAEEHPTTFVKFHSGFRALLSATHPPRSPDQPPSVFWWFGPTGAGKTRFAFDHAVANNHTIWKSSRTLRWWPGYEQQHIAVIDDFRKDFITFHGLLTVLDRYPETIEVKGGHVHLNSPCIIVTSPTPPWEIYDTREDVGQLLRRITQVVRFTNGARPTDGPRTDIANRIDETRPLSGSNVDYGPGTEFCGILGFRRRLRSRSGSLGQPPPPSPDSNPVAYRTFGKYGDGKGKHPSQYGGLASDALQSTETFGDELDHLFDDL